MYSKSDGHMEVKEKFTLVGRLAMIDNTDDTHHTILVGGVLKSGMDVTRNNGNWEMLECRVAVEVFQRYKHHPDCAQGGRIDQVLRQNLPYLEYWQPVTVVDFLPQPQ